MYELKKEDEAGVTPCHCVGPQDGDPFCPCMMNIVNVKDGRRKYKLSGEHTIMDTSKFDVILEKIEELSDLLGCMDHKLLELLVTNKFISKKDLLILWGKPHSK